MHGTILLYFNKIFGFLVQLNCPVSSLSQKGHQMAAPDVTNAHLVKVEKDAFNSCSKFLWRQMFVI